MEGDEHLIAFRTTPGMRIILIIERVPQLSTGQQRPDLAKDTPPLSPSKHHLGTTKVPQHSTSQPCLLKELTFLWRRRRLRCRNAQEVECWGHGCIETLRFDWYDVTETMVAMRHPDLVLYYQQHPPDDFRDALATGSGETKKKLLYRKRYGVWNHAQQLVVNPVGNDLGEKH